MRARSFREQFPYLRTLFLVAGLPLLTLLVFIGVFSRMYLSFRVTDFTRDLATLGDLPFYAGALSTLGLIFWSATAGICFFAYALVRRRAQRSVARFIGLGGLLTLLLLVDDAYLLHDEVFPQYLGIPEPLVLATYPILTVTYIVVFRETIACTNYLVLVLSLAAFGASILVDLAVNTVVPETGLAMFLEDGSKLIGVVAWLGYFAHTGWEALDSAPTEADQNARRRQVVTDA